MQDKTLSGQKLNKYTQKYYQCKNTSTSRRAIEKMIMTLAVSTFVNLIILLALPPTIAAEATTSPSDKALEINSNARYQLILEASNSNVANKKLDTKGGNVDNSEISGNNAHAYTKSMVPSNANQQEQQQQANPVASVNFEAAFQGRCKFTQS